MATRMQQRRGTAAQWTSANPILNAGEIGWESDTNKFKIGDGVNHWADLDYFIDSSSTVNPQFGTSIVFEGATADAYETTLAVTDPTADRTITLPDATGTVVVADGSGNVTVSGNLTVQGTTTTIDSTTIAVTNSFVFEGSTADAYETTLTVIDPTADRTITLKDASGTVAFTSDITTAIDSVNTNLTDGLANKQDKISGVSDSEIGYLANVTSDIQSQLDNKQNAVSGVSDAEIATLDGVTSSIQSQLDGKREISGDVNLAATKVIVFEGATDDAYETTITVTDPTADRTITLPNATGTVVLVDATQTLTNKSISSADNTISITASTVSDFTEVAQDAIGNALGTGLSYNDSTGAISVDTTTIQARVADVSDTEIGYLNGVTSAIQTQLDGKSNTGHTHAQSDITDLTTDLAAKADLASPTFTGTVNAADLIISGDLTVNGTTTTVSTSDLVVTDPLIYIGEGNEANLVDVGVVGSFDDGTYQHTGLVRDASASKWKLFKGVTDEPTTTINFAQGSLDALAVGALEATTITPSSGIVFSDGTQTKEGLPSITSIIQKTDSYTLSSLTERDSLIEFNKASAVTVTIPANSTTAYPVGTSIDILQTGSGQVTVAGAVGVTVNGTPGLKLRAQWSSATLFKRATDTWVVMGDLSA